jgi:hypothetical protein
MTSRLNKKDLELIQTGKTIDLSEKAYGYMGGEFTKNPRDYVEVLIYNLNETLIESGIVDSTDYSYNSNTGIKLNTGTILRKMGYDRGRYIVKYNFLRKIAGSYETILVDENGLPWNGPYHQMGSGRIMTGEQHTADSKLLFLKDYSYFVHEISDSRSEVRLATQLINERFYKEDFLDAQRQEKNIAIKANLRFIADTNAEKQNSLTMESSRDGVFTEQMTGGVLVLDNAFIKEYLPEPNQTWGTSPTEEIESEIIQARFIISADEGLGSEYVSGDRNWSELFEIMKDVDVSVSTLPDTMSPVVFLGGMSNGIGGILIKPQFQVVYNQKDDNKNPTIRLKSVSSKPNVATTYTWEITGFDFPDGGKLLPATADDNYKTGDVEIRNPETDANSLLKVVDKDKLNGSEIEFRIFSSNTYIGIKLTIEPKDGNPSTIWLPAGAILTNKS